MTLNLLEADIVRAVANEGDVEYSFGLWHLSKFFLLKRNSKKNRSFSFDFQKERSLYSGKRIDLFGQTKNGRCKWIIEFKIHGTTDSLVQLEGYADEVYPDAHQNKRFHYVQRTLIARTFDDDCLFFAEKLGIQVLQLNAITKSIQELRPVVDLERRRRRLPAASHHYGILRYDIDGGIHG